MSFETFRFLFCDPSRLGGLMLQAYFSDEANLSTLSRFRYLIANLP